MDYGSCSLANKEAQSAICPPHKVYHPQEKTREVYDSLYALYRRLYFDFGGADKNSAFADVLPTLIQLASKQATAAEMKCPA